MEAQELTKKIIKSWETGLASSEIYYMLTDIICAPHGEMTKEVLSLKSDLYQRMLNDDEPEFIVEDFVCGSFYRPLREFLLTYK